MRPHSTLLVLLSRVLGAFAQIVATASLAAEYTARTTFIEDRKAVIATVEPVHQLAARGRIGGTIVSLDIKEGDEVASGAKLAIIADQKLVIQMQSFDQRIKSLQAQRDKAKNDFDRADELLRRGTTTRVLFDQAKTALDVAERNIAALQSDRKVTEQTAAEGIVLAPGAGRVLAIPVSIGRVVMPGETIATIAEDQYILRLQLPERHAKFMRAGDVVTIGARGLKTVSDEGRREGRVRIVYPEIQGGRVIADVEVDNLGDYFVGERARVYVPTGRREAIVIPFEAIYRRAGVNYVRLRDASEVVVQPGERRADGLEILSGLRDGDILVTP